MEELVCKTYSTKIENKSIKTCDREKENIQMLSHCIKLYFSIKIMIKHEIAIILSSKTWRSNIIVQWKWRLLRQAIFFMAIEIHFLMFPDHCLDGDVLQKPDKSLTLYCVKYYQNLKIWFFSTQKNVLVLPYFVWNNKPRKPITILLLRLEFRFKTDLADYKHTYITKPYLCYNRTIINNKK